MQRHFYATSRDLLEVCREIARALPLRYDWTGDFSAADLTPLTAPSLSDLEPADGGGAFLLTPSDVPVETRRINTAHGARFAVDELVNPSSATLKLGFRSGPQILTPGSIGTTAKNGLGVKIVRQFEKEMGRQFVRVRAYWVGHEALAMLHSGARLTLSEQSAPEFDLVPERTDA